EQHLAPVCDDEDLNLDNCDSSNDDSSVEIILVIDECENELVRFLTYF
ncbi:unnamed protein product, partial [Rotaria sp. Silwood2]